jgi:hypothetical protein
MQFRPPLQQAVEGQQHLARALGVIDAADRHDDLLPAEFAPDLRHPRHVLRLADDAADQLGMGADGKGVEAHGAPADRDRRRRHRLRQRGPGRLQLGFGGTLLQCIDLA